MKNRSSHGKKLSGVFAVFGMLGLWVGVLFVATALITDYRMGALLKNGTQTTAKVISTYLRGGHTGTTPFVRYEFADQQGAIITDDDAYPFTSWDSIRAGDPIGVIYLSDNPSHNALADRVRFVANRDPAHTYAIVIVPWILSGVFFFVYFSMKRAGK